MYLFNRNGELVDKGRAYFLLAPFGSPENNCNTIIGCNRQTASSVLIDASTDKVYFECSRVDKDFGIVNGRIRISVRANSELGLVTKIYDMKKRCYAYDSWQDNIVPNSELTVSQIGNSKLYSLIDIRTDAVYANNIENARTVRFSSGKSLPEVTFSDKTKNFIDVYSSEDTDSQNVFMLPVNADNVLTVIHNFAWFTKDGSVHLANMDEKSFLITLPNIDGKGVSYKIESQHCMVLHVTNGTVSIFVPTIDDASALKKNIISWAMGGMESKPHNYCGNYETPEEEETVEKFVSFIFENNELQEALSKNFKLLVERMSKLKHNTAKLLD